MSDMNRQWTLAGRPSGFPEESNFSLVESAVPDPGVWISLTPGLARRQSLESFLSGLASGPISSGQVIRNGRVTSRQNGAVGISTFTLAASEDGSDSCRTSFIDCTHSDSADRITSGSFARRF